MSVVTPPPPSQPTSDDLEALIREARARQRRRATAIAAVVAAAAALGLGLWAAVPNGGSVALGNAGGSGGAGSGHPQFAASGRPRGPVYQVGSVGGVTWVRGLRGLWLTADAGKTWRVIPLSDGVTTGSTGEVAQVKFADREHGWILLDRLGSRESERYTELGRTSDGGRTWLWSRLNLCEPTCNGGASLSFLDRQNGFLEAGTTSTGTLFRTSDGGVTWHPLHPIDHGPIAFLDELHGFLVEPYVTTMSTTGYLFATGDGGRAWQRTALGQTGRIDPNAPAIFGRRVVITAPDAIWVSGDAGTHWTRRQLPVRSDAWGVIGGFSAVSPTTWFVGKLKRLWLTTDGGRSWSRVAVRDPNPTNPNANVLGLDFTSRLDGWALFGTTIFHTRDGGVHWTREEPVYHLVKRPRR